MSEEHDPIDPENYFLPKGRWRIRYYRKDEKNEKEPEWTQRIIHLIRPTKLADLMLEGFTIGSCWQLD